MGLSASSIKKHIFIPGMCRSGTTWLAQWLSSHPDIATINETYLISFTFPIIAHHLPKRHVKCEHVRQLMDSIYCDTLVERGEIRKTCIIDKSPKMTKMNPLLEKLGYPVI